jgi:hypothetical protein
MHGSVSVRSANVVDVDVAESINTLIAKHFSIRAIGLPCSSVNKSIAINAYILLHIPLYFAKMKTLSTRLN